MDPGVALCLDPSLRSSQSPPESSFRAIALLKKTLAARATRLESSASIARLAAEKEAYKTTTAAKRLRAPRAKSASDFMRQTIRNREESRMKSRDKAVEKASRLQLQAETAEVYLARSSEPHCRGQPSHILQALSLDKAANFHCSRDSAPTSAGVLAASRPWSSRNDRQKIQPAYGNREERDVAPTLSATSMSDRWNLEDDDDIRALLDRAYSSARSTFARTASLVRPATSGGRRPRRSTPEFGHLHSRSQASMEPTQAQGISSDSRRKPFVRRPHTTGASGRVRPLDRRISSNPDMVQRRREMLIRSHGEGYNVHLFATEPFETTAMGRKAGCFNPGRKPERMPWTPAKTLSGLDKLQRSRMLMNQRPMVSKLNCWTKYSNRRECLQRGGGS